jgi:CRISPR-associated protein Csx10
MKSVLVTVTLEQGAALGVAGRSDHRQETHDHVPGSVLRGALAAAWLGTPEAPDAHDPRFREVFEGEGVFGPLHSDDSAPTPLSRWVHKTPPDDWCRTPWWDEATGGAAPPGQHCTACGPTRGKLERSKGQPAGSPEIRSRTHVKITEEGVAERGALFRRAALAPHTVLRGYLTGPAVEALRPAGRPVTRVRLGGRRSTTGFATLTATEAAPAPVETDAEGNVVLRLASPGVFVNRYGHPTDKPDVNELKAVLGVGVTIDMLDGWTRWTTAGGWHLASGLPKPTDRAVAAGSTYRIRCRTAPATDRLVLLAARGVGLRRREGFGAVHPIPESALAGDLRAIAPLRSWPRWSRVAGLVREHAQRPLAPDHALRRMPADPSLDPRQRAAAMALVELPDRERVLAVLDAMERS